MSEIPLDLFFRFGGLGFFLGPAFTLIQRFGSSYGAAYGWADTALKQNLAVAGLRGLAALEKDVELDHLRPHYRMASHPPHANPKSILFNPDLSDELQGLLTGPNAVGMADPGHAVCVSTMPTSSRAR